MTPEQQSEARAIVEAVGEMDEWGAQMAGLCNCPDRRKLGDIFPDVHHTPDCTYLRAKRLVEEWGDA